MEADMRTTVALLIAFVLAGCAATSGERYVRVYDHKYNEMRLVRAESPGSFVGTGATHQPARPAGQHP